MVTKFEQFKRLNESESKRLNESTWDSLDKNAAEVDGYKINFSYVYDTEGYVGLTVYLDITPAKLKSEFGLPLKITNCVELKEVSESQDI